ncbi:transglycosylase SLT domain-containing protein [Citreimonas sp.]|uniref:transglycosylase SLT domain-containing protein n=1 Tax=Citreimonas sp. TaxID=3036715 RepID=UPI004057F88C
MMPRPIRSLPLVLSLFLFGGTVVAQTVPPAAQTALPAIEPAEGGVTTSEAAVAQSPRPVPRPFVIPPARWDETGAPRSWTMAVLQGLRGHARALPAMVPADINAWCPGYRGADLAGREAFWVGLISSLAWHESTHRPNAVGGGGQWYGLVQIYPPTARLYDCQAQSGEALKDPGRNLSCALRIMARTVPRDGVVSEGMRGVAADWGPFHSSSKRADMRDWVRRQPYCRGLARSLRPQLRPFEEQGPTLEAMDEAKAETPVSAQP